MMTVKKATKYLLDIAKYLVVFIIIYVVINLWRSPDMPDGVALTYQNSHGQITDVATMSHDKPILVYFWGTWCGVCRLTSPNVQALHADGYEVLTVAVSSGDDGELLTYMNEHGYDFTTVNDTDGQIFRAWQGQVTPSFVIVHDGQMTQSFTGIAPLWLIKLRLWITTL